MGRRRPVKGATHAQSKINIASRIVVCAGRVRMSDSESMKAGSHPTARPCDAQTWLIIQFHSAALKTCFVRRWAACLHPLPSLRDGRAPNTDWAPDFHVLLGGRL
jgi:hypothetical protein